MTYDEFMSSDDLLNADAPTWLGAIKDAKPMGEDLIGDLEKNFEDLKNSTGFRSHRAPIYIPGCSDEAFEYAYSCAQSEIHMIMSPKQYDLYLEWGKRTGKIDG